MAVGAVPGGGLHRERRIDQMRPRQRHEVGAAGGDDGVDLVGAGDRADAHRRDAGVVADLVGERRLVHAAVDRLGVRRGLAGGDVDQVAAGLGEGARHRDRIVAGEAAVLPVGRRDAHRHRLVLRPGLAHGAEHLEREAQAVFQRAAVFVGALVGQRRDEAREQIAVRGVQLDHVEARALGALHRLHVIGDRRVHVGARHRARHLAVRIIGQGRGRDDRPVALGQRLVDAVPHQPGRALAPGMAELQAELRAGVGVDEIDDALPGRLLRVVVHAGAAGRDARRPPTRRSSR